MNCAISYSKDFLRKLKHLRKRHRSLDGELADLVSDLHADPFMGTYIGHGMRKIRLRISSKGRGKSGGARVITHTVIVSTSGANVKLLTTRGQSTEATLLTPVRSAFMIKPSAKACPKVYCTKS